MTFYPTDTQDKDKNQLLVRVCVDGAVSKRTEYCIDSILLHLVMESCRPSYSKMVPENVKLKYFSCFYEYPTVLSLLRSCVN